MRLSETVKYIGVNDYELDLFEGQYPVPNGMAYNSYVILDEQIAVMDSVDVHFTDVWMSNLHDALGERTPDYLVVQHMEPDHSGSILRFMEVYPSAKLVASARAFLLLQNFFGIDFADRRIVVGENDMLSLGSRTLTFITAAMVHWPEVIMTYDDRDKILFSADAFGKFGALDTEEDWTDEARRYYFGIVGKYGAPVQAVLKKLASFDLQIICPLHGPALTENLNYYIDLYNTWSSYTPEEEGILIAYTSMYGNTKQAVELLAAQLRESGCSTVVVRDLARCGWSEAVADAFRYSKLVLAPTTYNGGIFPFMRQFINHLTERGFSNHTVAFIENGSWAPAAARVMKKLLEECRNLTYADTTVTIRSGLSDASRAQVSALAAELSRECSVCPGMTPGSNSSDAAKKFVCKICGYVYEGASLPADFICPLCKRGAGDFEELP